MHGPTFMANPLAAAVAGASVRLLLEPGLARRGARDRGGAAGGAGARAGAARAWSTCGCSAAIGVVQLDHPVDVAAATEAAVDAGVWLRPFRDLVYTMPPYVCTPDDLAAITAAVCAAAAAAR